MLKATLEDLIQQGDLNAIDRIKFRQPEQQLSAYEVLDADEWFYQATVWNVAARSRKYSSLMSTCTTSFKNDNVNHPIERLDYETSGLSFGKVTLTLFLRNTRRNYIFPHMLAIKLFQKQNPGRYVPSNLEVAKSMCFTDLEVDMSAFEFIADHMCPEYLINGEQCRYGSLYFMCEHRNTLSLFESKDSQPLAVAGNLMLYCYNVLQRCALNEDAACKPIVETIEGRSGALRY